VPEEAGKGGEGGAGQVNSTGFSPSPSFLGLVAKIHTERSAAMIHRQYLKSHPWLPKENTGPSVPDRKQSPPICMLHKVRLADSVRAPKDPIPDVGSY
jgi:hypothetical protein